LANTLGIAERVHFLGARSSDEVRQLMQHCALFVLPSQTAENGDSEALGIVFNEASACGIPVVSTRHGGIPEAVLHGETGLLVDERDDRALAEAMDQILGDPELGNKLGNRGREYVCDVFDLSKQTAKLEDIYETLLR
jgi:colanic acid/amylovoran biosynthesis glycosyltransferase